MPNHRARRTPFTSTARAALLMPVFAAVACSAAPEETSMAVDMDDLHGDCDGSDTQGDLVNKARRGDWFDAHLSWRQTNDAGQGIAASCNLSSHQVTDQGMAYVPLHCSGKSQVQSGYARVGARWGTSRNSPSCTEDYCAAVYIQDGGGQLREVVRDIYLKDRFFCSQASDRRDERLDVDACTYADVVLALKAGENTRGDDQSNLAFVNGKLSGYPKKGLKLRYKMYPCGSFGGGSPGGSPGGTPSPPPPPAPSTCDDKPTPGYTCAQQKSWGKCNETWMTGGGYCRQTCGRCQTAVPTCEDKPTPGYTCAQQKGWGKCQESWMIQGGYCRQTCGHCSGF